VTTCWWLKLVILDSGGGDQEDCGLKRAQANSSRDPISKNPSQKTGLLEWLKVKVLSSSPGTTKKERKKVTTILIPEEPVQVIQMGHEVAEEKAAPL
jgi:hypothetical protein